MAKLTTQEKVTKFHYATKQFQAAMDDYNKYLQAAATASNRKQLAESNDQGLSSEAKKQAITQWEDYRVKSEKEAEVRMNQASEAFENMKKLLS